MQLTLAIFEAVTASATFRIAGIADVDLRKFACHSVTVEFAFGDAARHTAVDRMFHSTLLMKSMRIGLKNIGDDIDKRRKRL